MLDRPEDEPIAINSSEFGDADGSTEAVDLSGTVRTPRDGPPADEVFAIDFARDFEQEAQAQSAADHASDALDAVVPESAPQPDLPPPSPENLAKLRR